MALVNLFGNLALDASVMAATPLLKQIDADLIATPYVRVVNPTTVIFPGIQNVNIANPSTPISFPTTFNVNIANVATPPLVQTVTLTSTPIVYSYQPYPYVIQGTVGVSNFPSSFSVSNLPGVQNVNLSNVATPPLVQSVSITSTPIVSLANTQVTVQNWPSIYPTQGVVNVNLANPSTPISTQNVSVINWPGIQNVNIANPTTPVTSIGVNNFPLGFNVNVANPSTPPSVQSVLLTSTPIVYSYQPYPYFIQGTVGVSNFPSSFSVSNFPGVQNVNVANQSTPAPVQQISFPVASQVANDGSLQGPQFQNINLFSAVAGTQATPLVLATSRIIRVLSYAFTSSVAGSVGFTSTPTSNFQGTGIGVTGINLGGPYTVGAQGGVSFSGTLQGPAFQAAAGTPIYIVASAGNVGGHITYVVI